MRYCWPWEWPSRSIITLKSVAFVGIFAILNSLAEDWEIIQILWHKWVFGLFGLESGLEGKLWPWIFWTLWEHPDFELCENIRILDVLTKLGFWPFWPWKWPWRSIMTLNLISLAFVPYVSLFSVICIVVLATFDNFVRRLRRNSRLLYLRSRR